MQILSHTSAESGFEPQWERGFRYPCRRAARPI